MTYDAVVIGGGISGMTAALILARRGSRVALLERSGKLAPIVRGFSHSGLYFDTGFHYAGGLDHDGVLGRFFRYLGISEAITLAPYAQDGFDLYRDPATHTDFAFPCGYARAEEHFRHHFPDEGDAIGDYFAMVRAECRRLPYLNLDAPFDPQQLMSALQGPSLGDVLERLSDNPGLKKVLSLHGLLYGVPPEEMPFMLHASVVGPYFESTSGIVGGGRSLVEAFEAQLHRLDVEILTGRTASRLELDGAGGIAAVHTADGERLATRCCIASVAPRVLLEMVPREGFRPAYRKRLAGLAETPSAHLLFAACEDSDLLRRRNLFLDGNRSPFADIAATPLEQRTLYLARAHAETGSEERRGLVVICPADQQETAAWKESRRGQRPAAYHDFKRQVMERLRHRVERECPELGRLTPLAGSTPLTVCDYAGNPGGGLYGVKHTVNQFNPQPPTRIKGLLLAGQGTAAPGILGATLSAFLCCGHLLGHDTLRDEVKRCI